MLVPSVFSSEETGGVSFDRWLVNLHIHSIQKEKIYMNVNETITAVTLEVSSGQNIKRKQIMIIAKLVFFVI